MSICRAEHVPGFYCQGHRPAALVLVLVFAGFNGIGDKSGISGTLRGLSPVVVLKTSLKFYLSSFHLSWDCDCLQEMGMRSYRVGGGSLDQGEMARDETLITLARR